MLSPPPHMSTPSPLGGFSPLRPSKLCFNKFKIVFNVLVDVNTITVVNHIPTTTCSIDLMCCWYPTVYDKKTGYQQTS